MKKLNKQEFTTFLTGKIEDSFIKAEKGKDEIVSKIAFEVCGEGDKAGWSVGIALVWFIGTMTAVFQDGNTDIGDAVSHMFGIGLCDFNYYYYDDVETFVNKILEAENEAHDTEGTLNTFIVR